MSEQKLVLLERCYDLTQAHMIRGLLESNDIPCFLMDENHSAIAWHLNVALGGARIMVLEEHFEQAKEVLDEIQIQQTADIPEKKPFLKKPYLPNILLGLLGLFSGAPLVMPDKGKKE